MSRGGTKRRPTYIRLPRDLAERVRGMGQKSWFQALLVASLQEVLRDLGESPASVALKQARDRYALLLSDLVACALGRIFRRLDAGVSVSGPARSGGDWSLEGLTVFRTVLGSAGEEE